MGSERMKRGLSLILAVLTLTLCAAYALALPICADGEEDDNPPPEVTHANAACVYNLENDRFIYELDAKKKIYPASTVKLMTAILAVEALGDDLDREITVPSAALATIAGNNIGIRKDEILTVRELLYALICGCANDAANVLAVEVAGSIEDFVAMMNEKAKELGALDTYYTNPTGMHHPAMVTTAADTAIIAAKACTYDLILEISSAEKYIIDETNKRPQRTIYNKNYYYSTSMEYKYIWSVPRGLNAGYTAEGGYCVATTASKDGLTYIVVVMGAQADEKYIYSYTEAANLIKWALYAYGYVKVLTTSDMICEVPVNLASKVDYVTLFPSENIELYLPLNVDLEKDVQLTWQLDVDHFTAPVSEGQVGGRLTVTYNGISLGTYDLVTRNSVNRNNILYVLDLAKGIIDTPQFRTAVIIVAALAVGYLLVIVLLSLSKKKKRRRR